MINLDEEVRILSQLLEEDHNNVRTKLYKYAAEDQHMRMQLMLKDYFKEEKALLKPNVVEDARAISVIFPDIPIQIIQDLLVEIGDHTDRSRIVIKNLCNRNSTAECSSKNEMFDRGKAEIKVELQPSVSYTEARPSTSTCEEAPFYVDPTVKQELFDHALEVFPDACPQFLQSLFEEKGYTEVNLVEVVQCLLDGLFRIVTFLAFVNVILLLLFEN